jgi:hypothetical protein
MVAALKELFAFHWPTGQALSGQCGHRVPQHRAPRRQPHARHARGRAAGCHAGCAAACLLQPASRSPRASCPAPRPMPPGTCDGVLRWFEEYARRLAAGYYEVRGPLHHTLASSKSHLQRSQAVSMWLLQRQAGDGESDPQPHGPLRRWPPAGGPSGRGPARGVPHHLPLPAAAARDARGRDSGRAGEPHPRASLGVAVLASPWPPPPVMSRAPVPPPGMAPHARDEARRGQRSFGSPSGPMPVHAASL